MALPSTPLPSVTTGQVISSSGENNVTTYVNDILDSLGAGTSPQGPYANVADAIAGKLDASGSTTATGPLNMGNNQINNVSTPSLSTDAANKGYVDAIGSSLSLKASVFVLASSNVDLSTGGLLTIDGQVLTSGQRVICVGQSTASENGIYAAASGAWSRTSDANTSALVTTGMYCLVTNGTVYANQGWVLITPGPITLGTTSLTFSEFNAVNPPGAATGANGDIVSMHGLTGSLQAPTQVSDANGNAVLAFGSTASAVNAVNVTNAATGNGPTISAEGTDTNINLNLNPKGTGIAVIGGSAQITGNGNPSLLVKGVPANTGVSPSSISGLVLWLKADAITGFSSGSALTTWTDSSGTSNNATASTTAPTYYTNRLNGLPIVTFNGTNDTMTLGTLISTAQTLFWVCREMPSTPAIRNFMGSASYQDFYRGSSGQYWGYYAIPNVTNGSTYLNGTLIPSPTTTVFPQGPFQIVSLVAAGNTHVQQITENDGNTGDVWYGDIAEIIVYNVQLTSTQRQNIEAYLANKWALPLTTPASANLLEVLDPGNNQVFVVSPGGGQQVKVYVVATGTTYAASVNDYIIVIDKITGSATAVNLPATPNTGQVLIIKDGKGDAATNNITITPAAGTIDGATSVVLSTAYAVSRLVYNGTQWNAF